MWSDTGPSGSTAIAYAHPFRIHVGPIFRAGGCYADRQAVRSPHIVRIVGSVVLLLHLSRRSWLGWKAVVESAADEPRRGGDAPTARKALL
jgi:hypothetical protein